MNFTNYDNYADFKLRLDTDKKMMGGLTFTLQIVYILLERLLLAKTE